MKILYSPYTSHEGNLVIKTEIKVSKIILKDINEVIELEDVGYLCLDFSCEVGKTEINISDNRIILNNVSFAMIEIEDMEDEDTAFDQIDLISKGSVQLDINNDEVIVTISEDSEEYERVGC
jgi:hypothetical protein